MEAREFSKNNGFTLIELLVLMVIISILSLVTLAWLNNIPAKARDTRRYSDLNQVQIALQLYNDDNGSYPETVIPGSPGWWTVCTNGLDPTERETSGPNGYIPGLAPKYISVLPTDPLGCVSLGAFKGYIYHSTGDKYKFATDWSAELGEKCVTGQRFADPVRQSPTSKFCSIYTSGAENW